MTDRSTRVGIVGLGRMGQPIALRLLAAGYEVHGCNRSPAAVEALAADGLRPAATPVHVAERADVVLTALPTSADLDQVFGDMTAVATPGQTYVDHSTASPGMSRRCAAGIVRRGATFLDAPVSGGPEGAAAGTLTIMAGGPVTTFDAVLDVFRVYGRSIRRCGDVGAGQAVKLVNQLLVAVHSAAIAEAAVFGEVLGADGDVLADLLPSSYGGSVMVERNLPRMLDRDFAGATSITLLLKDLGIILDEARARSLPLLLGGVTEQRFLEARARGMGEEDISALVRLWEDPVGCAVSRGPAADRRVEEVG